MTEGKIALGHAWHAKTGSDTSQSLLDALGEEIFGAGMRNGRLRNNEGEKKMGGKMKDKK